MSETRTCDYDGCTDETTIRSRTGCYCDSDHSAAAVNGWDADKLTEYEVEYDGVEGTFRAPSKEKAERHFRAGVIARQ